MVDDSRDVCCAECAPDKPCKYSDEFCSPSGNCVCTLCLLSLLTTLTMFGLVMLAPFWKVCHFARLHNAAFSAARRARKLPQFARWLPGPYDAFGQQVCGGSMSLHTSWIMMLPCTLNTADTRTQESPFYTACLADSDCTNRDQPFCNITIAEPGGHETANSCTGALPLLTAATFVDHEARWQLTSTDCCTYVF